MMAKWQADCNSVKDNASRTVMFAPAWPPSKLADMFINIKFDLISNDRTACVLITADNCGTTLPEVSAILCARYALG
jgi:hypothetical protein